MARKVLIIPFVIVALCAACFCGEPAAPATVPAEVPSPPPTATAPPTIIADQTEASSSSVTPFPEEEVAPSPATSAITSDASGRAELLDTLVGHTDRVYGLDFSSDGRWLASGSEDGTIRLWDVASRQEMRVLDGEGGWDVFFAPDDGYVASMSGRIWDVASGKDVVARTRDRAQPGRGNAGRHNADHAGESPRLAHDSG